MNTRLRLTLAVTLVCCGAAEAHHSIAGMYDEGHPVTLDGSVLEFHFVNPHPFVLLKANDQNHPVEMQDRFVASYRQRGGPIEVETFEGLPERGMDASQPEAARALDMIVDFARRHTPS